MPAGAGKARPESLVSLETRKGTHELGIIKFIELEFRGWSKAPVEDIVWPVLFFRRFFGISKQILAEILSYRKIFAELD